MLAIRRGRGSGGAAGGAEHCLSYAQLMGASASELLQIPRQDPTAIASQAIRPAGPSVARRARQLYEAVSCASGAELSPCSSASGYQPSRCRSIAVPLPPAGAAYGLSPPGMGAATLLTGIW